MGRKEQFLKQTFCWFQNLFSLSHGNLRPVTAAVSLGLPVWFVCLHMATGTSKFIAWDQEEGIQDQLT